MLLDFCLRNYKSFKDEKCIEFLAAAIKEESKEPPTTIKQGESSRAKKIQVLNTAVIYGPNASGKSNLFHAVNFLKHFIKNSSKNMQIDEEIGVKKFAFSTITEEQPTYFEINFVNNGTKYRYGVELDSKTIKSEWLFSSPKGKEARLFTRDEQEIDVGPSFKEGKGLETKTRPNALFLSVVAQFNGEIATEIMKWINNLNIISGLDDQKYIMYTIKQLEDKHFRKKAIDFLNKLDTGIEDLLIQEAEDKNIPPKIRELLANKISSEKFSDREVDITSIKFIATSLYSLHKKYDDKNSFKELAPLPFEEESKGTQKLLAMLGPIIDTLKNGKILFIDELDARLHPNITKSIVKLFNSKKTNKNNAQLIFATHDTNLLSSNIFRRDQIWFIDKDQYGASYLYSLLDFNVRTNAKFEREYLMGKYDAVPYISNISNILD